MQKTTADCSHLYFNDDANVPFLIAKIDNAITVAREIQFQAKVPAPQHCDADS